MSKPITNYDEPIRGVFHELISAESALNMPPEPIEPDADSRGFLSETDAMVKHAMEHLHEAFKQAMKVEREISVLKTKIYRLEVAAAEHRATKL